MHPPRSSSASAVPPNAMSQPNPPNPLPIAGASAPGPVEGGSSPLSLNPNVMQTDDTHWAALEQRGEDLKNHLVELSQARQRGDNSYTRDHMLATAAEFRDVERQLRRRLPNPTTRAPHPEDTLSGRPPSRAPADPFIQGATSFRAMEAARHSRFAYSSEESGALPSRARRGQHTFDEASTLMPQSRPLVGAAPNPLRQSALSRTRPSPNYLSSNWNDPVTSSGLHHRRGASNSAYQGEPAMFPAEGPLLAARYLENRPQNHPPPSATSLWPAPPNLYANPASAYGSIPVSATYTQPTIFPGYSTNWNTPYLPQARGQAPRQDAPIATESSSREDRLGENHLPSSFRGRIPNEGPRDSTRGIDVPSADSFNPLLEMLQHPLDPLETARKRPTGLDLEDGRPAPKTPDELTVNLECKICFSQLASVVLIPCGKFGIWSAGGGH